MGTKGNKLHDIIEKKYGNADTRFLPDSNHSIELSNYSLQLIPNTIDSR